MTVLWIILTTVFSLWISSVQGRNTIRYASGCSVDLCTLTNATNTNGTNNSMCSDPPDCYLFDTSLNTSICAPQVMCSLFDPCNSVRRCATNTSVCVINTCCMVPVCIPLALTSSCSMYTSTYIRDSSSTTICPNATWTNNSTTAISNYLNGNYWLNLADFVVDNNNNLYAADTNGYRILKYALNNPSVYNVVAVTNVSSTYQASSLFVDSNGIIYTAESAYQMSNMMSSYRIVKYNQSNVMNGTVVYGPTTCGTGVTEMCSCASLFVDRTGSIYCSDSTNHRVLKITPFATSASVIAGTSGVSGSGSNQLNYPSGIYVDGNGALYVTDQNNYRVMKFASGSSYGTILFTLATYQSPTGLILDNAGSVYAGTYSGIYKYIPATGSTFQIITQISMGASRVRLDTYGNIYTSGNMMSNIYRYNITANNC